MINGVPIARIRGIEIRVPLAWVIVVALVAALAVIQVGAAVPTLSPTAQWALGGVAGVAFFVSAMLHDLAHALVAKRRGVPVPTLVISFFGGTTPGDATSDVPGDDLAIAVSGPVVSTVLGFALLGVALALTGGRGQLSAAFGQLATVLAGLNLLIGLVNLVPAYPMDGGRIVRAIAWRRTNSVSRGWAAAAATGRLAGFVVIAIGVVVVTGGELTNGAMIALAGWFLILSSRAIRERLKVDELIGGLTVGEVMERDPTTIHPGLTVDTVAPPLLDQESPTTAVPVTEGDRVVGVFGIRELRRVRQSNWPTTHVGDAMTKIPPLAPIGTEGGLLDAVERIQRAGVDGIPVLDGERLVGIITRLAIGTAVRARTGSEPIGRRPRL